MIERTLSRVIDSIRRGECSEANKRWAEEMALDIDNWLMARGCQPMWVDALLDASESSPVRKVDPVDHMAAISEFC